MLGTLELVLLFANYTIGSYFIIFPWAFANSGALLYTVATIAVMVIYVLIGRMMLEQLSRAESLQRLKEEGYPLPKQDALIDYEIRFGLHSYEFRIRFQWSRWYGYGYYRRHYRL